MKQITASNIKQHVNKFLGACKLVENCKLVHTPKEIQTNDVKRRIL